MGTAKSEICPVRRRHCISEGETLETKYVKKRYRDPSVDGQQGEPQQRQQGDQSNATATSVKRSSRFRGVSRSGIGGLEDLKLIYGTKVPGIRYRGRRENKVTDYEKEIEIMQTVTKEGEAVASQGVFPGIEELQGIIIMGDGRQELGECLETIISISALTVNYSYDEYNSLRTGFSYLTRIFKTGTQEDAARAYNIAAVEYRGINAVTAHTSDGRKGEQILEFLIKNTKVALESQPIPTSNLYPIEHTNNFSILSPNPFIIEDLECPNKQDVFEGKTPFRPRTKSSSPTAQSSIFKELVKKNLNLDRNDEDTQENDTENPPQKMNENEVEEVFYNGINHVSFIGMRPCLELDKSTEMPSYIKAGQSLWNGALSMPPSH